MSMYFDWVCQNKKENLITHLLSKFLLVVEIISTLSIDCSRVRKQTTSKTWGPSCLKARRLLFWLSWSVVSPFYGRKFSTPWSRDRWHQPSNTSSRPSKSENRQVSTQNTSISWSRTIFHLFLKFRGAGIYSKICWNVTKVMPSNFGAEKKDWASIFSPPDTVVFSIRFVIRHRVHLYTFRFLSATK